MTQVCGSNYGNIKDIMGTSRYYNIHCPANYILHICKVYKLQLYFDVELFLMASLTPPSHVMYGILILPPPCEYHHYTLGQLVNLHQIAHLSALIVVSQFTLAQVDKKTSTCIVPQKQEEQEAKIKIHDIA
jgi:hypothetical protein